MKSLRVLLLPVLVALSQPVTAQDLEGTYESGRENCQWFYSLEYPQPSGAKWKYCITKSGSVYQTSRYEGATTEQGPLRGYLERNKLNRIYSRWDGSYMWTALYYFKQSENGSFLTLYSCNVDRSNNCKNQPEKEVYGYVFDASELSRRVRQIEQREKEEQDEFWRRQEESKRRTKESRENNGGKYWWQTYPRK